MSIAREDTIEVQHKWEAEAEWLLETFEDLTSIQTESTQTVKLQLGVKTAILQEEPPDVWFDWPGANLDPYVEADVLASIDDLWTTEMERNFLEGPKEFARRNGTYYTVPTNIHRINNLFYDIEKVEAAGVDPARIDSPSEFLEALASFEDYGPFAQPLQDAGTIIQLWGSIVLGEFGVEVYEAITNGEARRNREAIARAFELLDALVEYVPEEAYFDNFGHAHTDHDAGAFLLQGDWYAAHLNLAEREFGTDWGAVPFPGTDGVYTMNMDGPLMTPESAGDERVQNFLQFMSNVDVQQEFNRRKGSIPPRTDVQTDGYGPFMQRQQRDFETSHSQVPTIAHGLAIRPDQLVDLKATMTEFVVDPAPQEATEETVELLDS